MESTKEFKLCGDCTNDSGKIHFNELCTTCKKYILDNIHLKVSNKKQSNKNR